MLIKFAKRVLEAPFWHPVLDVIHMLVERPGSRHAFDPANISMIAASEWARGRPALSDALKALAKSSFHLQASDAITLIVENIRDGESQIDAQSRSAPSPST